MIGIFFKWIYVQHLSKQGNVNVNFKPKPSFLRSEWISIGLAKSSDIKNQLYDITVTVSINNNLDFIDDIKSIDVIGLCFKAIQL